MFAVYVVFPTRMRVSFDRMVPNYKATSCSANIRGKEKCGIVGII